jgi:hypothetical protein
MESRLSGERSNLIEATSKTGTGAEAVCSNRKQSGVEFTSPSATGPTTTAIIATKMPIKIPRTAGRDAYVLPLGTIVVLPAKTRQSSSRGPRGLQLARQ